MTNLLSQSFEEQLINLINNSGLPADTVYYIVKNMATQLQLIHTELAYQEEIQHLQNSSEDIKETIDSTITIPVENIND